MSSMSKLARNGSHTSVASSGSSIDTSSHNHFLNAIRSSPSLRTWLQESWSPIDHRHERIAAGVTSTGIAVLTRELMEMHVQQAPDIRGMMDCLPTAAARAEDMGFRQKLRTWPMPKQETLRQKLGTWPLTKTEALLTKKNLVQPPKDN